MSDFWANRRAAVAREEEAENAALETQRRLDAEAAVADKSDDELLEELGLPDPAEMNAESDFKAFLQDAVPARLRTRALRQLWRVNPVLANLDGLIEYGEDYTDAATVVENLQTTYQVGKGMLAHIEEMARQEEAKAAEEDGSLEQDEPEQEDPEQTEDEAVALVEEDADSEDSFEEANVIAASDIHEQADPLPDMAEDQEALHMPRHRRMTFTFEDKRAR
ncbi:MAG: DUF3306 domain-containing protein [Paracoccaceae bacterium]